MANIPLTNISCEHEISVSRKVPNSNKILPVMECHPCTNESVFKRFDILRFIQPPILA